MSYTETDHKSLKLQQRALTEIQIKQFKNKISLIFPDFSGNIYVQQPCECVKINKNNCLSLLCSFNFSS